MGWIDIKIVKVLSWGIVIFWMLFIFYLSQQPAHVSNGLSKGVTEQINKIVEVVTPWEDAKQANHVVRKNAHFIIFFFLGIFVFTALKMSGMKGFLSILLAFFLCMAYAVADEYHQLFVDGRGGQLKDVLIDCAGAASGIMIASIISFIGKIKKEIHQEKCVD
ncbi:VanZ family protein [Solibacillus sp. FSL W8-0474]|uniref:VanZ family protein n=1 Tax=Solibacillus sp. FSL W8-0474 TaxID=2975336 RepID=UPI0030F6A508